MSYERLEREGGLHWPCYDENHPGELFLHSRLWKDPVEGRLAPFSVVEHEPPVEMPDAEYPFLLTTGRRLDSYNTGVQTGGYTSPLRRGETLDLSPEDAERMGLKDGDPVRVTSRRGSVVAPVRIDRSLRAGLVFMTLHFQDEVNVNLLTIDETDPKSGTAEFKACAVRVEPVKATKPQRAARARRGSLSGSSPARRRAHRGRARGGGRAARPSRYRVGRRRAGRGARCPRVQRWP